MLNTIIYIFLGLVYMMIFINIPNKISNFYLFILSIVIIPIIAFFVFTPWFAFIMAALLIQKYFGVDPRTRSIDMSSFQRKYGGIANNVSMLFWVLAILHIVYSLYKYFF